MASTEDGSDGEKMSKKRQRVNLKLEQKIPIDLLKKTLINSGDLCDPLILDANASVNERHAAQRKRFAEKLEETCAQAEVGDNENACLSWEDFLYCGIPFFLAEAEELSIKKEGAVSYGATLLQLRAEVDLSELVKDGVSDGTWLLLDEDSGDDLIPISPHQYPPYICSSVRLVRFCARMY